jgi:dethiobiotin synthetase
MSTVVVAGTDTGIGKTVFSAGLVRLLEGIYWKPIQSGLQEATDSFTVERLAGISSQHVLPEAYRLQQPLSPHRSAELDGVTIDLNTLRLPRVSRPLIVEAAGGLMVPLTRQNLFIDLIADWRVPVVLCARTTLGTINHTLLAVEALRSRAIPLAGVCFIGDENPDNQRTVSEFGKVRILGRLSFLNPLTPETLLEAFQSEFDRKSFEEFSP